MIEVPLPQGALRLAHLVVDLNGTLAVDGRLVDGVAERLAPLRDRLAVVAASGDTFSTAAAVTAELGIALERLPGDGQARAKLALVERLGAGRVAMIGNGANDALALRAAALAICVVGGEGAALAALLAADVAVPTPLAALELLAAPTRLVATLRT